MVSIIIPVYNAEKYIRQCLDSIKKQTYTDWELILIDDGSSDSSGLICDEYSRNDSRIKVLHKENGGVSSARNLGLQLASGEWIAFVDADDWVLPEYLVHLLRFDSVDSIIGCYRKTNGETKNRTNTDSVISLNRLDADYIMESNLFYFPWGRIYKRDIIKNNKIIFDENLILCEDTCFTLEYLSHSKMIALSPAVDYTYTWGESVCKYKLSYKDYCYHFSETKKKISDFSLVHNINLEQMKIKISILLFAYYKNFLKDIETYNEYRENTRGWNITSIKNISESIGILNTMLYYVLFTLPFIGFAYFKIRRTIKQIRLWQKF